MPQAIELSLELTLPNCHLAPLKVFTDGNTLIAHWVLVCSEVVTKANAQLSCKHVLSVDAELPVKHYLTILPHYSPERIGLILPPKMNVTIVPDEAAIPELSRVDCEVIYLEEESIDCYLLHKYFDRHGMYTRLKKKTFEMFTESKLEPGLLDGDSKAILNRINEKSCDIVKGAKKDLSNDQIFMILISGALIDIVTNDYEAGYLTKTEAALLFNEAGLSKLENLEQITALFYQYKDKQLSPHQQSWYKTSTIFAVAATAAVGIAAGVVYTLNL